MSANTSGSRKLATRHLVHPEHMNHHQSLYAGILSERVTEAALVGITEVLGRTDHFVRAALHELQNWHFA